MGRSSSVMTATLAGTTPVGKQYAQVEGGSGTKACCVNGPIHDWCYEKGGFVSARLPPLAACNNYVQYWHSEQDWLGNLFGHVAVSVLLP
jgi:hypothetical protein